MQILEKVNKELKVTIIANLHHLEVAENIVAESLVLTVEK